MNASPRSAPGLALLLAAGALFAGPPAAPNADERAVVAQANAFRRGQGLGALQVNPQLQAAAANFAAWMARTDRYGHEADGRAPAQRVDAEGYEHCLVAENIAFEYRSVPFDPGELPGRFVQGWIRSPGHRAKLLDAAVVDTGVGIAQSRRSGRWFAVQVFGRPMSRSVEFQVSNPGGRAASYRLDRRRYELPARSTMTHKECTAPLLRVLPGRKGDAGLRAADGQRYELAPGPGTNWRIRSSS
jgi:hypothetical protein